MLRRNGQLTFSPTDLNVFFESPFASYMDRRACDEPSAFPGERERDPQLALAAEMGDAHEAAFLARTQQTHDVCVIARDTFKGDASFVATEAAIRAGRAVIFQAALRHERFFGYADFLFRVEQPGSTLGWTYQVVDTKLARKPKPYFLLQLCAYAEMLAPLLGHRPTALAIVTGDGALRPFHTDEFFYYYRSVKDAFLEAQDQHDAKVQPYPEVGVDHGHWADEAEAWFESVDHPCRVAGISKLQTRRLAKHGIETFQQLAETTVPRVPRMAQRTFARLRGQARLQRASNGKRPPLWELLTDEERGDKLGLALLPPASKNDLFFDMEGYPFEEGGLEYLFGVTHEERGARTFTDFWAYDKQKERRAFEDFVDWVYARWRKDESLHVFHYAPYEPSALKRLMGTYGTREHEIDSMLRGGVFVDLYRVVRQALRVGEPRYSLKNIETLYRKPRDGDVATAGDSIVEFARWREAPDGATWEQSKVLGGIRAYNRDDCDSTCELAAWLRDRQREAKVAYVAS